MNIIISYIIMLKLKGKNMNDIEYMMQIIEKFSSDRDWEQFHNPKDLAIGLSIEANELLDFFRFKNEAEVKALIKDDKKREAIGEELADVFFLALRFAQLYNYDVVKTLEDKLEKNCKKYPIEKAKGKNIKYTEF